MQPITSEQSTIPKAIASLLQEEDEMEIQQQQPDVASSFDNNNTSTQFPAKQYQQRRDNQVFNIEFDGIVLGEGVLGNDA